MGPCSAPRFRGAFGRDDKGVVTVGFRPFLNDRAVGGMASCGFPVLPGGRMRDTLRINHRPGTPT